MNPRLHARLRFRSFLPLLAALFSLLPGSARAQPASPHDYPRSPGVVALAFSPEGNRIAAAYFQHAMNEPGTDWAAWVACWDLQTGRRTVYPGATAPLTFGPDGALVVPAGPPAEDRGAAAPEIRRRPTPPAAPPTDLAPWFAGDPQTSKLFREQVQAHLWMQPGESHGRYHLAFAPRDGQPLWAIVSCGRAVVRRFPAREPLHSVPLAATAAAFSPDRKQLVTADAQAILRFWDLATGRVVRSLRLDDKPADTFRVAAIQCASEFGRPEKNREQLAGWVQQAAYAGAVVVVLPETAVTGYLTPDLKTTWQVDRRPLSEGLTGANPKDVAETIPGPSTRFFANVAASAGVYLTVPLLEVDRRTGRYYNSVAVLDAEGRRVVHYRKCDPWPWAEQGWATPGDLGHPVVDTPFGRLSPLVCYDIHKQAKPLADLKVDTLLYSIAWVEDAGSRWFAEDLPRIAKTHRLNLIGANWTLPRGSAAPAWHGYGQSRIIDRTGAILAQAHNDLDEAIVLADLPLPGAAPEAPAAPKAQ